MTDTLQVNVPHLFVSSIGAGIMKGHIGPTSSIWTRNSNDGRTNLSNFVEFLTRVWRLWHAPHDFERYRFRSLATFYILFIGGIFPLANPNIALMYWRAVLCQEITLIAILVWGSCSEARVCQPPQGSFSHLKRLQCAENYTNNYWFSSLVPTKH